MKNTFKERVLTLVIHSSCIRSIPGLASMSFYVRLGDGSSYKVDSVVVDLSTPETFIAGGLRIEPLYSMRRYRISFNGLVFNPQHEAIHMRAVFV